MTSDGLSVEILPGHVADTAEAVDDLCALINAAYAIGEEGLWTAGADRTSASELIALIRAGEIAAAHLDGRIVGSVRVQQLDNTTAEFGMLVSDPQRRGVGIGRELVAFVERWARFRGLTAIQLEVLSPLHWTHPAKEVLHAWYTRLGFRVQRTGTFADDYPTLAPLLATECVYSIYRKTLRTAA